MRYLPPFKTKQKYWRKVEKEIRRLFDELIYKRLSESLEIPQKQITNSENPLLDAFQSGRIYLDGKKVKGKFNSTITKAIKDLGGKYEKGAFVFKQVPPDIKGAVAIAESEFKRLKENLVLTLDDMDVNKIDQMSLIPDMYDELLDEVERDFSENLKGISVPFKLTQEQRGIIASQWGQNLDLYIKNWASENIIKLRQQVQQSTFKGRRAETMIKQIQDNYNVSQNKARFLARQETNFLMSEYKKTKYQDQSIQEYRWSTSQDERVRDDHKALNGKVFNFSNPPIVDRLTGRRAHPGEDFECRCEMIPIVPE